MRCAVREQLFLEGRATAAAARKERALQKCQYTGIISPAAGSQRAGLQTHW